MGNAIMTTTETARAQFFARLYGALAKAQTGTNVFLSPFSIQTALAMCAAGAKGATRQALADLIGAPAQVDAQNRQYAETLKSFNEAAAANVQWTVANALWSQQGVHLEPAYKKVIADCYGGTYDELDFQTRPDQAVQTINAWVARATAGKIKELMTRDLIAPDTRLVVTNAVHFKGRWDSPFDKNHTWDEDWHGAGAARKVPMMQQTTACLYSETSEWQAVDLAYQGRQLSMLLVLPRKTDGLPALETAWASASTYERVTTTLAPEASVVIALPRFSVESTFSLKPTLSALGAGVAFSPTADFSAIAHEPLTIAEVVHKAFVDVNEEGTEAAAASGMIGAKGGFAQPKVFRADHPFFFAIRDRKTGVVLFCGRVVDPR